jgi:hypothetical protein
MGLVTGMWIIGRGGPDVIEDHSVAVPGEVGAFLTLTARSRKTQDDGTGFRARDFPVPTKIRLQ